MRKHSVSVVFGTRPEIIKLSEVIRLLEDEGSVSLRSVHLGQHWDYEMSRVFFEELAIPRPTVDLGIRSGSHASQTGAMLQALDEELMQSRPNLVITQGDTNSTLAASLAAVKLGIPVAHVEAGLRCHDWFMPEEINRKLVDQVASMCFAPTALAASNLAREGRAPECVKVVGNTIVEVVERMLPYVSDRSVVSSSLPERYVLLTLHRAENTDNDMRLRTIMESVAGLGVPVIFPVHPRTRARIDALRLMTVIEQSPVTMVPPLGFLGFLTLCASAVAIVSDSGGIQEEATVYKRPVVILRDSTERPEVLYDFGVLVGAEGQRLRQEALRLWDDSDRESERLAVIGSPFGDGSASRQIVEWIVRFLS